MAKITATPNGEQEPSVPCALVIDASPMSKKQPVSRSRPNAVESRLGSTGQVASLDARLHPPPCALLPLRRDAARLTSPRSTAACRAARASVAGVDEEAPDRRRGRLAGEPAGGIHEREIPSAAAEDLDPPRSLRPIWIRMQHVAGREALACGRRRSTAASRAADVRARRSARMSTRPEPRSITCRACSLELRELSRSARLRYRRGRAGFHGALVASACRGGSLRGRKCCNVGQPR